MDWWIYSNKLQEEKRDSRLKDMLRKIKNQSMNLIWTDSNNKKEHNTIGKG